MIRKSSAIVYIALLTTVLLWGSAFPVIKIVLMSMPSSAYMFLRFGAAGLVFLILLYKKKSIKMEFKKHLKLFTVAFFEPGLYFMFETAGIQRTSASSAAIIIGAVPAAVALFAAVFLKEKIGSKSWAGIILSISGIIILTMFDKSSSIARSATFAGNILTSLAVISAACYMVTVRKIAPDFSALEITSWQIIYGALIFLPFFLKDFTSIKWESITPLSIQALVFLVIFPTLIACLCYNFALTRIAASKASMFLNGIPICSVITSAIILKESISLAQIAGGIVIISGVTLANLDNKNT